MWLCFYQKFHYKKYSHRKTTMQQRHETGKSPASNQAAMIPAKSDRYPATGEPVALTMAGKVITDNVT